MITATIKLKSERRETEEVILRSKLTREWFVFDLIQKQKY